MVVISDTSRLLAGVLDATLRADTDGQRAQRRRLTNHGAAVFSASEPIATCGSCAANVMVSAGDSRFDPASSFVRDAWSFVSPTQNAQATSGMTAFHGSEPDKANPDQDNQDTNDSNSEGSGADADSLADCQEVCYRLFDDISDWKELKDCLLDCVDPPHGGDSQSGDSSDDNSEQGDSTSDNTDCDDCRDGCDSLKPSGHPTSLNLDDWKKYYDCIKSCEDQYCDTHDTPVDICDTPADPDPVYETGYYVYVIDEECVDNCDMPNDRPNSTNLDEWEAYNDCVQDCKEAQYVQEECYPHRDECSPACLDRTGCALWEYDLDDLNISFGEIISEHFSDAEKDLLRSAVAQLRNNADIVAWACCAIWGPGSDVCTCLMDYILGEKQLDLRKESDSCRTGKRVDMAYVGAGNDIHICVCTLEALAANTTEDQLDLAVIIAHELIHVCTNSGSHFREGCDEVDDFETLLEYALGTRCGYANLTDVVCPTS